MSSQLVPESQDADSGLSEQEREEIRGYIDEIAQSQRVSIIEPDVWQRPLRGRDRRLPLVVNLISIVVLAAAAAVGVYLLSNAERSIATMSGTFQTAEGALIAELRQQTAATLDDKDAEIAAVRRELNAAVVERDQILAEIDARVAAREAELLRELAAELRDERVRLVEEGVSQERINELLRALEAQRRIEIREELATLRARLENEFSAALEELQVLQQQLRSELRALQNERIEIRSEAAEREQVLLDEAAVTAQQPQAAQDREARVEPEDEVAPTVDPQLAAELEQLRQADATEQLFLSQIEGLKDRISARVAQDDIGGALATVETLRTLLQSPEVIRAVPASQRSGDLEILLALERLLLQFQIEAGSVEAANAVQAFEQVETAVAEARSLLAAGNETQAEERYLEAIRLVPQAIEGHLFLIGQEQLGFASERQTLQQEYEQQIATLEAELEEARQGLQAARVGAANVPGESADQGRELEIQRERVATLETELAQTRSELDSVSAALDVERSNRQQAETEVEVLAARLEEARETARASGDEESAATIERLQEALTVTRNARDDLAASNEALTARLARIEETVEGLRDDRERLVAIEEEYQALRERYTEYVAAEEEILASGAFLPLARARVELSRFLTADPVNQAFPNISLRINRYNQAFEREGRQAALLDAIDVVTATAQRQSTEEQLAFLVSEEDAVSAENPVLAEFINELRLLIQGR